MNPDQMLPGVDVASFQGLPAAWQPSAGHILWAGVKLTELGPGGSRYVNPDAVADWAYLAKAKLGRIAYLFAHPSTDPGETASFFGDVLGPLGLDDADAIGVDLEVTDGLSPEQVNAWALEVTNLLHARYDRHPLLYTYLFFAEAGNCASLGHLPLWMSDPSSPPGHPRIPAPWKTFAIHQYSTGGAIDRDLAAYTSLAAMAAALGKPQPPQEETMKFLSRMTLDAPAKGTEVAPNREPVALAWKAGSGLAMQAGGHAVKPGVSGAVLSAVNLCVRDGSSLRLTLAERKADGTAGEQVDAEFTPAGGWLQFTAPFDADAGSAYEVTVTNFGKDAATITQGSWQLLR